MKTKSKAKRKRAEPVRSRKVAIDVVLYRHLKTAGCYSDAEIAAKLGIDAKTYRLLDESMMEGSWNW